MIEVSGKGLQVTEALRKYTEKRFRRLLGNLGEEKIRVRVVLGIEGDRSEVRAHASLRGRTFDVHAADSDMYAGIDAAQEKLRRVLADAHAEKVGPARHRD